MNQKLQKPISDFTEKQRKAYKLVMKALARKKLSKSQIYIVIKKANIYNRHRDIKETSKMLINNPNTPIDTQDGRVVNKHVEGDSNA